MRPIHLLPQFLIAAHVVDCFVINFIHLTFHLTENMSVHFDDSREHFDYNDNNIVNLNINVF